MRDIVAVARQAGEKGLDANLDKGPGTRDALVAHKLTWVRVSFAVLSFAFVIFRIICVARIDCSVEHGAHMPPGPAFNWICVAHSALDILNHAARYRAAQLSSPLASQSVRKQQKVNGRVSVGRHERNEEEELEAAEVEEGECGMVHAHVLDSTSFVVHVCWRSHAHEYTTSRFFEY